MRRHSLRRAVRDGGVADQNVQMNFMEQQIIGGIVIALVAALFGWTLSQLTIGRKMADAINTMNLRVEHVENDVHRTQDQIENQRKVTNDQIIGMSSLVEKVLDTANKLIEIVRIQNALLNER